MKETPSLSAALVQAQQNVKPVVKDAYNKHHKYAYASAETMLEAARMALNSAGLALSRSAYHVLTGDMPMLLSSFRLDHVSGEGRDFVNLPWPILEGNGRPFDKALAGALTTSQAYFVRDLLQMPKEDENEIDRRNDEETVAIEVIGIAGAGAIRRKLKARNLKLTDMIADMRAAKLDPPADLASWPTAWGKSVDAWIERKIADLTPPTTEG
jgi:hypothetical protein